MNANVDIKSIKLKPLFDKLYKRFGKHAAFAAVFVVLLAYVFVVLKISSLAQADPGPEQEVTVQNSIPKIDKGAVNQIQSLEQSNTQIHSLFESARNNPFQE